MAVMPSANIRLTKSLIFGCISSRGSSEKRSTRSTRNYSNRSKTFATSWPKSSVSSRLLKRSSVKFATNTVRRAAKGLSIVNILELKPDEKIAATIRIQSKKSGTGPSAVDQTWDENLHIMFATQSGIVKKSNLSDYANVRRGGIIAIQIEEGDRLIDAKLTNGNNEIVLITKDGMSLRFHEEKLRDQGRNTVGVWGIRPGKGDHVVASAIVDPNSMLLVAGENGIGKRTSFDDYRRQSRGGKGIITMRTGEKTGDVVGALTVREADEIMLITNKGQMVRTRVKEIRETGRNTMGVKLMDLRNGEKLQAIAPVVSQVEEEEAQTAEPTAEKS